jgi:hypothetical protein
LPVEADATVSDATLLFKKKSSSPVPVTTPLPVETDATVSDATLLFKKKSSSPVPVTTPRLVEVETAVQPLAGFAEMMPEVHPFRQAARAHMIDELQDSYEILDEDAEMDDEDQSEEGAEPHGTWQKVVEHTTPPSLPIVSPPQQWSGMLQQLLPRLSRKIVSPRIFFWLSMSCLIVMLLAGTFGITLTFGRGNQRVVSAKVASSLQISPSSIALGGIVTLRGTGFTPGSAVEMYYDRQLPLLDTGGMQTTQASKQGAFSDTFIIGPSWSAGQHMLYATNLATHQQFGAMLLVTGQSALQGPPHLLLSANTLDLGAGDIVTNSSKLLALSNAGGGQLNWHATSNQPWLQISPASGLLSSGGSQSAIVAVERSSLKPGSYSGEIFFTSNTEQVGLNVSMQVTQLQASHQAILQLSLATLTFNSISGGEQPDAQAVTLGNPGELSLNWGATVETGASWLSMSQTGGTVAPGGFYPLTISVHTSSLAPGVYKGELLFFNQGSQAIQGNLQSLYVNLTVAPPCMLALSPDMFTFTGTAGQANPANQQLRITAGADCLVSQHWTASLHTTSGGNWLRLDKTSGSTPTQAEVGANLAGLAAGTYTGTVTLTTSTGPQIAVVTLTVRPVPCALTGTSSLTLQGVTAQTASVMQTATLGTTGYCPDTLNWTAIPSASSSAWLSATPAGTLTSSTSATVVVDADLASLGAGTYTGTITVTALDSSTDQIVGSITITVTLNVQAPPPPCALGSVSASELAFTASVGSDPSTPTQTVFIGVSGTCAGNVTIAASPDSGSSAWLSVTSSTTIASGNQATLTITVASSALTSGEYIGTITLTAVDGNGPISGSSQTVTITLTVQ